MSSVSAQSSWLSFTPALTDLVHYNFWDAAFVKLDDLSVAHRIVIDSFHESNPFGIADKYLDDAGLYWVIIMFNGLADPIHDLRIGKTILIPDKTELVNLLNKFVVKPQTTQTRIVL